MNKDEQNKTINMTLGKDVLNILIEAEIAMAKELGFNPTHSQAERDEYAIKCLTDEADIDVHERFKSLKNINLDKAVS